MTDREEATIQTYDNNAAAWSEQHNFDLSKNNFANALNEFYKLVTDGSTVLEIGCRGGRDAAELVKHYDYTGTDASEGMIGIKAGDKEEFEVRDTNGAHEERLFTYWTNEDFTEVLKRNNLDIVSYTYKPVSQRTNWHIYLTRNKN